MEARLRTSVLVSGLIRLAEEKGGFAAVLARGDSESGSVLVILSERGRKAAFLERLMESGGRYSWQMVGERALENPEEAERFLERRRNIDPDLWLIELDVASAERFTAEMKALV